MTTGTIIAESIRVGARLEGVSFAIREIERVAPTSISREQRDAGIVPHWTLLHVEVPDAETGRLAGALAESLEDFGWYANFQSSEETFVVFADRVFRYATGDESARAGAESYARAHGVPEAQMDW